MIILEKTNGKKFVAETKKQIIRFCKGCKIYYSIGGMPIYTQGNKQAFFKMLVKTNKDISVNGFDYKLIKDPVDSIIYIDRI